MNESKTTKVVDMRKRETAINKELEDLTKEKAVFILKLLHHSDQVSRLIILRAIDLADSMSWMT